MFTFINASILAFIFAIAIPLFIHLFNKQRKKKIKFSSIRFLKLLEKQRLKRIKIYDYLLILLRTLVILTLILAFARPTLTSKPVFSPQSARTTSVIILDTGINMRRYDDLGNRYLRAQSIMNRLLEKFNPEDEIFIVKSTHPDQILNKQSSIKETTGSFMHGKWSTSFIEAIKIFKDNPNFNQELHIISDFQFQENTFESVINKIAGIRIFLIKIGSQQISNLGIDTLEVKNQIFEINKPIQLETLIINSTPEKTEPVEVHLFVNQQRVAHRRVPIEPMSMERVALSFSPKSVGYVSGYIEINDDDLLADNRYYFALKIPSGIKLLFIDDNPSVFLKAALASLSDQTDVQITMERYNSWARQNFQSYDILILSNFSVLDPSVIQRLKNYLDNVGSILLIPGMGTIPAEYNRMASALGISSHMKDLQKTTRNDEFYYLKEPNLNHPLFTGLFRLKNPELSKPKFYRYFKFSVSSKDQIILAYQNNDPFLIRADHNQGSVFIMSSYIDDGWTDIQYRGIFLPLLSRIFHFGASHASQVQSSTLVEKEKIVTINYASHTGDFYLKLPDGEKNRIVPRQQNQNLHFHMNNLKIPGLYHILAGDNTISTIPVNAEIHAIHQPYIDLEKIEKIETVRIFSEKDNFEEAIIQARFGFELWKLFIILALLLMGVELFIIKKMEGKVQKMK
jgi:hypothetical protein